MTFQRDLAWRYFNLLQQSSIAHQFAHYALGLNYEMLPQDVVHQAKRSLLDTLGCAIGAYEAPGRPICEDVVKELGGAEEATVFGSGLRTSAHNATLVNSFMVRFLDYNDQGEKGGHHSDSIPAILAVSEREKASGSDFLTAVVISYELAVRTWESAKSWGRWMGDTRAGWTMPATLGRLMGLNEEQIANAIGICASGNFVLRIMDTAGEEKVMRKNLRFGWGACAAILSCMLAKKGFTGPVRVFEGERGINQILFQGEMDFERMTDFRGWRILETRHKYLCAMGSLQANLGVTLAIVKKHDLKPEDIAAVHIKMSCSDSINPTVPQKYPRNAETADHSLFYLTAIAIKERSVTPDSIRPEKFTDPIILDLIEKITIEGDPNIPDHKGEILGPGELVEIVTKDGRKFQEQIVTLHGFGDDPLTDEELENKFREMAAKYMDEEQIRKIFKAVWNLESLDDINKLMRLMVFKSR